jgi:hypothetical protein
MPGLDLLRARRIREHDASGKVERSEGRKPRLSLRLPGEFLLRFADRQLTALLFQPPPRFTRFEPFSAFNPN